MTLYNKLPTICDLSIMALEECAIRMRPSRLYKLYVNAAMWPYACMVLRHIGATAQENPFAPYINLLELKTLTTREWFIEGDAGDAWGSEGI